MGDSWEDLDEDDVQLPTAVTATARPRAAVEDNHDSGEEGWEVRRPSPPPQTQKPSASAGSSGPTKTADDRPLLLVDLTALSDGALHNRFDKASCNDADLKRQWIRKIEADYAKYESDTGLIRTGVVRSCGATVWRDALAELRDAHPGHFWAPVFPP